jgi:hypothetical protein
MAPRKKASTGKANGTEAKSAAKRPAPKTIAAEAAQPTLREGASRNSASETPAAHAPALRQSVVDDKDSGRSFVDTAATMHRGFAGSGLGMLAVNRKLMDMMRDNLSSSLELARGMARAETPVQSMQLQIAFWRDRVGAFTTQAQELRALMTGAVESR